jgi:energy-coupling factor transporter ATP-binding protein EcfA2
LYLDRVDLRNFRAFRHASINLPESGLVLLAGANNTGKSALLSALDVVAGRGTPPRVRHADASEPAEVCARFVLSEAERERLLGKVTDAALHDGAFSWVEWRFTEDQNPSLFPIELRAPWPGHRTITVARGSVPPEAGVAVSNVVAALGGHPDQGVELANRTGGAHSLDYLASIGRPELAPLLEFLNDWRGQYFHFYALRTGTGRTRQLTSEDRLAFSGENLPGVLLHVQTNKPQQWEQIRRLMAETVPDLGMLETPTSGQQIEVAFRDPYTPTFDPNLKDLGTGVEQLLMTVVMGVTQPAPSMVVIEEPETNLHPAAQRALLNLLREWGRERLLLVSTHSPVFLDRAVGATPVLVTHRSRGASTVTHFTEEFSEALAALGVRRNELLTADRLLFLEGPSDQDILTVWFPSEMRNPRMAVIDGQGGDNALHAHRLAAWIEAADALHGRRVLYLRDRDELPRRLLERLQQSGAVHVLERRELENYLLDAEAIQKVLSERLGRFDLDPAAVAVAMRQIADGLKATVLVKRVGWELAPITFVDHKLRDELGRTKPPLEQFQDIVLGRLPERDDLTGHIGELWRNAEDAIASAWEDQWSSLAPGHDLLVALWATYGIKYDKQRDGTAIAKAIAEPPYELGKALREFLAD